jgi:hypothetical protein
MATVERLSENSRQGFEVLKQACIGLEGDLSRNLRWGCGHIYDETPVDIAVYVRNDPVNLVDPDGRDWTISVTVWAPGSAFLGTGWYANTDYMSLYWLISNPWGRYGEILDQMRTYSPIVATGGGGGGITDWWLRVNYGINTDISNESRWNQVSSAKGQIEGRIQGDCLNFLNRVIGKLKGTINDSIKSAQDLLSVVGGQFNSFSVYGRYDLGVGGMAMGGGVFAQTKDNKIYLGEDFFNPSAYAKTGGGDQVSTLIHEFFHLTLVGNGKQIIESDLDSKSDTGNWGSDMRTKCGKP